MPRNKDALARYRIIHRELKTKFRYKSKRLAEICSDEIGIPISWRTVQKDLNDLKNDTTLGFFLPIKEDKSEKVFYYDEVPDSIFPSLELDSDEISALLFYVKTISQYQDYPAFTDIKKALKKVVDSSNIEPAFRKLFEEDILIHTEKHPPIEGLDFIPDLLDSIKGRRIIEVKYQKFEGDKVKTHRVEPLFLKEDKHLWYLIGKSTSRPGMITLALDRFHDLVITDDTYSEIHFDVDGYFKYSFGVTVSEEEPVEVIISFTATQGKYLKALNIHPTQEIIKDTDEELQIKVKVIPSYEFYSKILSYGEDAIIISPDSLRTEMMGILNRALTSYKQKR